MAQGRASGGTPVEHLAAAGGGDLERGREAARRRDWAAAYEWLSRADQAGQVGGADLEQLAMAAYLLGHRDDAIEFLQRSHHEQAADGAERSAARSAFWLAFLFFGDGEVAQGSGWLGVANRHLNKLSDECAEHGYVLLPLAMRSLEAGDYREAREIAVRAAEIGVRAGSPDVTALALHVQGRALLREGQAVDGLALLDEAMVLVLSSDLTPVVSGLIYCSVLEACHEVSEVHRAREWTNALNSWCDGQTDMVMFTGNCLVHRAEILQLQGAWADAVDQAQRACERFAAVSDRWATGAAVYQLGEVYRVRGERAEAESAYQQASEWGHEPQPGLALLRLSQGQLHAADASIRRLVAEASDDGARARVLPAAVEITLAAGDRPQAQEFVADLERLARQYGTEALRAQALVAAGALRLASGDASGALAPLRESWRLWRELDAPYEAARVRVLIGRGCRMLGDEESARLELASARRVFQQLGARPDVDRVDALAASPAARLTHGLTERELEVLRLVATGLTNREVARQLVLADRTIDRHVSNIFTKLGVSSRAAATAFAHRHDLV